MKLYENNGFEVFTDRSSILVVNRHGDYFSHAHFSKIKVKKSEPKKGRGKRIIIEGYDVTECLMVIEFVQKCKMADSVFIVNACMRLSTDDQYREACKQKIDKLTQKKYINVPVKHSLNSTQRLRA